MIALASVFLVVMTYLGAVGLSGAYLDALEVGRITWLAQWVGLPIVTLIGVYLVICIVMALMDGGEQEQVLAAWWGIFLGLTVVLPLALTQFGELYPYRFRPLYLGAGGMIVFAMFEYGNNRAKRWQYIRPTPEA